MGEPLTMKDIERGVKVMRAYEQDMFKTLTESAFTEAAGYKVKSTEKTWNPIKLIKNWLVRRKVEKWMRNVDWDDMMRKLARDIMFFGHATLDVEKLL